MEAPVIKCPHCGEDRRIERVEDRWRPNVYWCENCSKEFHLRDVK